MSLPFPFPLWLIYSLSLHYFPKPCPSLIHFPFNLLIPYFLVPLAMSLPLPFPLWLAHSLFPLYFPQPCRSHFHFPFDLPIPYFLVISLSHAPLLSMFPLTRPFPISPLFPSAMSPLTREFPISRLLPSAIFLPFPFSLWLAHSLLPLYFPQPCPSHLHFPFDSSVPYFPIIFFSHVPPISISPLTRLFSISLLFLSAMPLSFPFFLWLAHSLFPHYFPKPFPFKLHFPIWHDHPLFPHYFPVPFHISIWYTTPIPITPLFPSARTLSIFIWHDHCLFPLISLSHVLPFSFSLVLTWSFPISPIILPSHAPSHLYFSFHMIMPYFPSYFPKTRPIPFPFPFDMTLPSIISLPISLSQVLSFSFLFAMT